MANDNHYLHRNHLASVKVVSDQNGVPYRQSTYQPFGELNDVVSQTFTPKHDKSYIGERHDPETGRHSRIAAQGLLASKRATGTFGLLNPGRVEVPERPLLRSRTGALHPTRLLEPC